MALVPLHRALPKRQATAAKSKRRPQKLPEYLDRAEIEAMVATMQDPRHKLLFALQWRAGLRVAEACALEVGDLSLADIRPTLKVRRGKGNKARIVPVHPELRVGLLSYVTWSSRKSGTLLDVTPGQAWRWVKTAYDKAVKAGTMPPGKKIGTHTLRHSAARHWLASGIPINQVSVWLGHSNLQTTLIYLRVLPDPGGLIEAVP